VGAGVSGRELSVPEVSGAAEPPAWNPRSGRLFSGVGGLDPRHQARLVPVLLWQSRRLISVFRLNAPNCTCSLVICQTRVSPCVRKPRPCGSAERRSARALWGGWEWPALQQGLQGVAGFCRGFRESRVSQWSLASRGEAAAALSCAVSLGMRSACQDCLRSSNARSCAETCSGDAWPAAICQ